MTITEAILLFGAGAIGSAVNAVVGGGASFISFPVLIFLGLTPIPANATTTVGLYPGNLASLWAQRKDLFRRKTLLPFIIPLSVVGGTIGALISANTSNPTYASSIHYCMLIAAVLFTFKNQIIFLIKNLPYKTKRGSAAYWAILALSQIAVTIYGGYFGAAMGILIIAFFMTAGIKNIHEANALRNISIAAAGSISAIIYALVGNVVWMHAGMLCAGAIFGGYFFANYVTKLPQPLLGKAMIVLTWAMTIYFFYKY